MAPPPPGTTPGTISLRPSHTKLLPGRHEAVVRFVHTSGQTAATVPVVFKVLPPPLASSVTQLNFTAFSGQSAPPAAQPVTLTAPQTQQLSYTVTAEYKSGPRQDWLELPPAGTTPQTLSLRPNTAALPPGFYTAAVSFTPNNGLPATTLTVSYSLSETFLQFNPFSPSLRVDANTTEAQLTFPATVTSGAAPLDWRVVSTGASWLSTSVAAGHTQTAPNLGLIVSKSALAQLPNGTHSATLTLAYGDPSLPERRLVSTFTLTVALPRFHTVMPYVTEVGSSLSHIVRGEGFSGLQSGQSLHIGTTTTSAYQIVSDTELRLNSPVLAAGAHTFSVDNALGLLLSTATLHAVQTPAFAELSLPHSNRSPLRVIYDPLRTAVYSVEVSTIPGTGEVYGLYRYRYVNGTWQEDLYVGLPGISDAAMDNDGQSLYLAVRTGLYRLDLNDTSATPRFLRTTSQDTRLEVMNDGRLLTPPSSCTRTVTSLDGRRTLLIDACGSSPPSPYRFFDASSGQLEFAPVAGNASFLALDRTAAYAVVNSSVYDAQWNLAATVGNLSGYIFSHDGRRLFGFFGDETQSRQVMHVLDMATPPSGGQFTRLAELTMSGAQTYDGYSTRGFVTPDGRTLIKVDSRRFHVFPIPGPLQ